MKTLANLGLTLCVLLWAPLFVLLNALITAAVVGRRTALEAIDNIIEIWKR